MNSVDYKQHIRGIQHLLRELEIIEKTRTKRRHTVPTPSFLDNIKRITGFEPEDEDFFDDEPELEDFEPVPELTFQELLFKTIDKLGLDDLEVYKTARLDRRLFSAIRKNADYQPSKKTALALIMAMHLNLDEALDLLSRAGYTLSPSDRFDIVIRYCIEHEIYNIDDINALLYKFDLPLLSL